MQKMIDTYVMVDEADTYITSRYRSNNPLRIIWGGLAVEDKEVLLVNSCTELDTLPFRGRKASPAQLLSFPRLPFQYGQTDKEIPFNVMAAQIELALWMSDDEKQAEYANRKELQHQGIKSFSIGDLSETYSENTTTSALSCAKVKSLLVPYLNGGYSLC